MKRKNLVIGGCGFIGSHLVRKLTLNGEEVVILDNLSTGKKEFIFGKRINSKIEIIRGDILNKNDLKRAFKRANPHTVFLLAAIHHIPTCDRNPVLTLRTNIEGVQMVLNECTKYTVGRLMFASTGAIYGQANTSLNELSPVDPQNVYGLSKKCAEDLIRIASKNSHCKFIIMRLFNTIGTNETNSHLIPDIMEQIKGGETCLRLGNLESARDYVHVLDVVEAMFLLSKIQMKENLEIINIGSGKEYSVRDIVRIISRILKRKISTRSVSNLRRKIDRMSQLADIKKIQSLIPWKPKRTLEEALIEILNQYQKGYSF